MKIYRIYDNGGKTMDRYCVVVKDENWTEKTTGYFPCLSLSDNCDSPQGFSQWGSCKIGRHLGKQVDFWSLPSIIKSHIQFRVMTG